MRWPSEVNHWTTAHKDSRTKSHSVKRTIQGVGDYRFLKKYLNGRADFMYTFVSQ